MADRWPDEDPSQVLVPRARDDPSSLSNPWGSVEDALAEVNRRARARDLERLKSEHADAVSKRKLREDLQKNQEDFEDHLRRIEDHTRNHDLIRRLMMTNQALASTGHGILGPSNLRRRDDVYSSDELARQIQRERYGGYPDSPRNCLCDGECDDCRRRRRSGSRSSLRSKQRHSTEPKQVNVIGPVYMDGYDSESPYVSYDDWPPVDIYKKRWGGLLPDKRLPWLTEDTLLDGTDIMRFPKRRRRRYYGLPYYY